MNTSTCLEKQQRIKELFSTCKSKEETYEKIIALGKKNPKLADEYKNAENLVSGCQSTMYLRSWEEDGRIYFAGESDALISSGLAVLLIEVYSGEPPETIIKCPPDYLDELNISGSLTPNRASGLYSIHLRMKQEALKHLIKQ
ncbi:MAG: SufE family protein [Chlamydiales bacterium]|nr:SufE family protein [Chlamydiia bacterium]MCP5506752.1 SufE family protein [Chlamydiales bacterium]